MKQTNCLFFDEIDEPKRKRSRAKSYFFQEDASEFKSKYLSSSILNNVSKFNESVPQSPKSYWKHYSSKYSNRSLESSIKIKKYFLINRQLK